MTKIVRVEVFQVDLRPKVKRGDAIQAFHTQETPMVRIVTDDGAEGTGYTYTIGTGGSSVVALIRDHLAPQLLGRDPAMIEQIWKDLFFHTHATAVGAITSLALCAIDTALWDVRCRKAGLPLHIMAGGAQEKIPVYDTEGGWLHLSISQLVDNALETKGRGFQGVKIKIGKPHVTEDVKRLAAVRKAIGDSMELMVDANQGFTVAEAVRRARHFEALDLAWFEEPLPAEDLAGHVLLQQSTSLPIAVGESIYSLSQFREYMQRGACSIVQTDVARIGGITPWLKCAHVAESFNMPICPHYLMELHVGLCAAVPNSPGWNTSRN
jgi:L-alanine-DL-glutamate epimerase-like enolase superfamily enzyme